MTNHEIMDYMLSTSQNFKDQLCKVFEQLGNIREDFAGHVQAFEEFKSEDIPNFHSSLGDNLKNTIKTALDNHSIQTPETKHFLPHVVDLGREVLGIDLLANLVICLNHIAKYTRII